MAISPQDISIFDGDIKEDREYWKKHQYVEARYFELKEVKQKE